MHRCPYCNSKIKKNTKFCPECGLAMTGNGNNIKTCDRNVAKGTLLIIVLLMLVIAVGIALFVLGGTDFRDKSISPSETSFNETFQQETFPNETTAPAIAFSDDPSAISAASQSIVKLNCYDKNGGLYATGSGFACFADNVIVTNYHVIEGGVYSIEASTEDGRTFDVQYVLATDEEKDIAILGTSTSHNLALLQTGNSDALQKGEKVVAIGSPLGLLNSVSTGVFSGYVAENGMDVLQFTASISSGSSGGALFNDAGEVLGITFASYEAGQNLNLAIPIAQVANIWNSNSRIKITVAEFFNSQIQTYSVEDILLMNGEFPENEFYVEGYVFSHNVAQLGDGRHRAWCTLYPSVSSMPSLIESNSVANDVGEYVKMGYYSKIIDEVVTQMTDIHTGDWVRIKCINFSSYEFKIINIEVVE